jgi:hypothetical protein
MKKKERTEFVIKSKAERADKTHTRAHTRGRKRRKRCGSAAVREGRKENPRERESCGEATVIIIIIIIITRNGIKIRLRLLQVDSINNRTTTRMVTVVMLLPSSRRLLRSGARTLTPGVLARVVLVLVVEGLE